jgi:hypothetical protein
MALKDAPKCIRTSKSTGEPCKNPAVTGFNVCRHHGAGNKDTPGGRPIEHGRYSNRIPAHIQEQADAFKAGDALDVLDELALQRALFANYLSRFKNATITLTLADIDYMNGWLSEITRTVERIVKMRNSTALTAVEVAFIASRIPDVVAKYIHDPVQQSRFVDELLGITPVESTDQIQLSAETASVYK